MKRSERAVESSCSHTKGAVEPREMTDEDIARVIHDFGEATRRAWLRALMLYWKTIGQERCSRYVDFQGVFTHFADAEEPINVPEPYTEQQRIRFDAVLSAAKASPHNFIEKGSD